MKRTAGLAALAVIAVAGLAPATAVSPQRALASRRVMRHTAAFAALAVVTITGLTVPAVASASPGRPGAAARPEASVPGGTLLWAARYRGPGKAQVNIPAAVVASPDGATVYVTGVTFLAHFSTVAYNAATGTRRWTALYYGRGYSQPQGIAVSPDGSKLFVTGFTTPAGACCNDQFATVAYDAATGARLWVTRTFSIRQSNSAADAVAVSPDGGTVYVAGEVFSDLAVAAYNAATGAPRWVKLYAVPQLGRGLASVAVSPGGSTVFLNGPFITASGQPMFATVAYSAATGTRLWAQAAPGGQTGSRDLTVSPDGSKVFVTGGTNPLGASTFTTTAYAAATGAVLWAKQYQGPQASSVANAVTVSPDGSQLFVTGQTGGTALNAPGYFATVAYATGNGKQLWARTYPAGAAGVGFTFGGIAIGVSPDGTLVFITGTTPGFRSNSVNFTTIAYRASRGAASWVARYRGRRDYANATDLAVSPAGQAVFVTGFVGVHDGCCDFGTVAYQP